MINYVTKQTTPQILAMWKVCFGDSQPYFDIYFREKYSIKNTLAYFEGDKVVASLQLLHYNFTYCDSEIPIAYISGACTLPEARKKGYMDALLKRTFQELELRSIPLTLLVPEEMWLLNFYAKYGYAQTFDAGRDVVSLADLMKRYKNVVFDSYKYFDRLYRKQPMTVQKTLEDFSVILEEAAGYNFPPKKSLIGMARIIDARKMLQYFAWKYPNKSFSIDITDPLIARNNLFLSIDNGKVRDAKSQLPTHLYLTIYDLAQALLGYHTSDKQILLRGVFPEHQPQMHFMME